MSSLKKIQSLLTPEQRRRAMVLLGLMFAGMVLETMGVGLVIPAIGVLVQPDFALRYPAVVRVLEAMIGSATPNRLVAAGMLSLLGLYLFKTLFLALLARRQMSFAFHVQAHLSQRLYRTYLQQPYPFHLQRNSGQLILNVVNEVNVFTFSAMIPAMLVLTEVLVCAGIGALLMILEPVVTLLVAVVLGGAAWMFNRTLRRRIDTAAATRQVHEGFRLQHLQQGLGGAKEVKLLGREEEFVRQYDVHNLHAAKAGQMQQTLQLFPRLWIELMGVIGILTLVMTALMQGRDLVSTVPTMALFAAAAFRVMPSVNRILTSLQSLRYAAPLIERLHDEMHLPVPAPNLPQHDRISFNQEIQLTGVSYRYPEAPAQALTDLTIRIRKGEAVGFVGRSGAGKSTLVDVILGLLPPSDGYVTVDGHDIQAGLRAWQSQIGYVPQTIFLTDDSLRGNVAFGIDPEQINESAVQRAIHAAQLEEFVASQPDGLDTQVGERGVRLSGGERQRIGIARALYHEPSVLLLDEATSALDVATEQGVMKSVLALRGSKTVLIVAHRLSTIEQCDRLYRLESGQIVGEGTAQEVLQRVTTYDPVSRDQQ